ncbi:MAG: hypothetical protein E7357_07680 [Clostridiales bacterium]|nr:hypothetical protein [Clostridiales bacterium]
MLVEVVRVALLAALLTQSCSLRSVTLTTTYRRSLISSLQGVINALLHGQLVPLDESCIPIP